MKILYNYYINQLIFKDFIYNSFIAIFLFILFITATFTMVYQGIILGWPSPMIPKLLGGEAGISITKVSV